MLNLAFAGTLGADPEIRQAGNSTVAEFRVAVNGYDRSKREKTTTWLKVNVWGKRGEQLCDRTGKGGKVAGSGQFEVQEYTTRDGDKRTAYVVTCQDLTLQSFVERDDEEGDNEPPPRRQQSSGRPAQRNTSTSRKPVDDDDIPF